MAVDNQTAVVRMSSWAPISSSHAVAQAPDCTGVSTVFNTDPNLQDELTTVSVAADLRQARARVSALSEPPPAGDMVAGAPAMRRVMSVVPTGL